MQKQLNKFYIVTDLNTKDIFFCNHIQEKELNNQDLSIVCVTIGNLEAKTFCESNLIYSHQTFDVSKITSKETSKIEFNAFIQ